MISSLRQLFAALRRPLTPFDRALIVLERGDPRQAIAGFTAILHADPPPALQVRVHNKRGVAWVRLGERDQAMRDFIEVLHVDAAHVPTIVNVGNMLFEDGCVEEAIAHYEAAVRIDDTYSLAHLNLGIAYRTRGRRGEAVRELRTANRLEGRPGISRQSPR